MATRNNDDSCFKGARSIHVYIDGVASGQVTVRKAYDNSGQYFLMSSIVEAASQDDDEPIVETQEKKPTELYGYILLLRILDTHGDRDYVGLNGLQLIDRHDRPIAIEKTAIRANPSSINVIPESQGNDCRTVDKLIDGVSSFLKFPECTCTLLF